MRKLIITESEKGEILKMHKNALLVERGSPINEQSIVTDLSLQKQKEGKALYDWEITFNGAQGAYKKIYALPLQKNDEFEIDVASKFFEPSDQGVSVINYKVIGPTNPNQLATPEDDVVIDGGTLPEFEVVANRNNTNVSGQIVCAKSEQDLGKLYLRKGCKNDFVKQLQSLLDVKGYGTTLGKASIDGVFGDATKNAVMKFQKEKNLKVDGIVGMQTWRALSALESVKATTPTVPQSAPVAQQPVAPAVPQPTTPQEPQTGKERRRERQDQRRGDRRDMQDLRARQRTQR
jgi:hypothetical protein